MQPMLRHCAICGNGFARRKRQDDAAVCCSRECGFQFQKIKRDQQRLSKVYGSFCSVQFSQCQCGKWFRSKANKKYCSPSCQYQFGQLVPAVKRFLKCFECGKSFESNTSHVRKFCSLRCGERVARRKRKLKERYGMERAEALSFQKLWDRDGGRCYICGHLCFTTHVVPHPLAPTIEHKIPLSLGGCNLMENAGIAHFICNTFKGDSLDPSSYVDSCKVAVEAFLKGNTNPWKFSPSRFAKAMGGGGLNVYESPAEPAVAPR